jgi:predicted MPP superfamily phosphohydrolase
LFIAFNLVWAITIWQWRFSHSYNDLFIALVARPAIAWQVLHAFLILPVSAVFGFLTKLGLLISRKRQVSKLKPTSTDLSLEPDPKLTSRRLFLKTAANLGFFSLVGFSAYAVYRQYRYPAVRRVTLNVPNLPSSLDGLAIAHLTDIHMGLWATERELDAALFTAKLEKPDLVVLTGDLVDRDANLAGLYELPFKRHLTAIPLGVWGILGNHDHFTNPARITQILRQIGVNMLVDRRHNFPDLPLSLVGLDDRRGSWRRLRHEANKDPDILDFSPVKGPSEREGDFRILLNHRPEGVGQAVRADYQLYLAGHTHGGQYAMPGTDHQLNLASFFYKYTYGLYPLQSGWLNVSAGLASVGVPFRLVTWPEISLITLKKA